MCKASAKQMSANVISAGGMLGLISGEFGKISLACRGNSPPASIADSSSRNAVSFSSALTMNLFPLWRCTRTSPFLSTQVGCRLARRLRRRTKVQYAAVGSDGKIAFDYVIRRLNALSSRLKSRSGGLTFAETPPSAISGSNWSPESAEVRPLQSAS
jgi:hypothetical protein